MNLNNFLKISSYFMVFIWLIASYIILLFEFGEILDHDIGSSPDWHCAVWPLVGSKLKCLDISWYAIELTSAIINSIFLVLLIVGMVKRKYILMMPWIIFRFTSMLVSWSAFYLLNYYYYNFVAQQLIMLQSAKLLFYFKKNKLQYLEEVKVGD